MTLTVFMLIGGLVLLLSGGELLVRGAVGLADRAHVTPLIVGLVIVGFGTSMPELVTSLDAALAGSPAIAWGNVVGSNIANMLLVLGASAILGPIALRSDSALRDCVFVVVSSLALMGMAIAGVASQLLALAMLGTLIAYVVYCYREERVAPAVRHNAPYDRYVAVELRDTRLHVRVDGWLRPLLFTVSGLALLVAGGRLLVTSAIDLAALAGLSETLIGLTVVAVGTSLPELATSLIAARKGHPEVAFGNVVGSSLYNILGIGGVVMFAAPNAIPTSLMPFDLGVMTSAAILVTAAVWFRHSISRLGGFLLVFAYAAFLAGVIAQG